MPLILRARPCWIGVWQGPDVRNDTAVAPHYDTAESVPSYDEHPGRAARHKTCGGVVTFGLSGGFCTLCETEGLSDGYDGVDNADWEERDYLPARLAVACLQAVCNGDCGGELADGDETPFCLSGLPEAQRTAARYDWVITDDGAVWCPGCRPPGVQPRPDPAELAALHDPLPLEM